MLRFRRSVEHWLRCAKKGHTVAPSPTQSVTVGPHTEVTPGRSNLGPACRRQDTVLHVCSTEGEYSCILFHKQKVLHAINSSNPMHDIHWMWLCEGKYLMCLSAFVRPGFDFGWATLGLLQSRLLCGSHPLKKAK